MSQIDEAIQLLKDVQCDVTMTGSTWSKFHKALAFLEALPTAPPAKPDEVTSPSNQHPGAEESTKKIKDKWKIYECHEDMTLDYAICQIYKLCDRLDAKDRQIKELEERGYEIIDRLTTEKQTQAEQHKMDMDTIDRLLKENKAQQEEIASFKDDQLNKGDKT